MEAGRSGMKSCVGGGELGPYGACVRSRVVSLCYLFSLSCEHTMRVQKVEEERGVRNGVRRDGSWNRGECGVDAVRLGLEREVEEEIRQEEEIRTGMRIELFPTLSRAWNLSWCRNAGS